TPRQRAQYVSTAHFRAAQLRVRGTRQKQGRAGSNGRCGGSGCGEWTDGSCAVSTSLYRVKLCGGAVNGGEHGRGELPSGRAAADVGRGGLLQGPLDGRFERVGELRLVRGVPEQERDRA